MTGRERQGRTQEEELLRCYGDRLYIHAPACPLRVLDATYRRSLRYVRYVWLIIVLYIPGLSDPQTMRRLSNWYLFISTAILGMLPSYSCSLIVQKAAGSYSFRSQDVVLLSVPTLRAELEGKRCSAPLTWNSLQKDLNPGGFIPLPDFEVLITSMGLWVFVWFVTCCEIHTEQMRDWTKANQNSRISTSCRTHGSRINTVGPQARVAVKLEHCGPKVN